MAIHANLVLDGVSSSGYRSFYGCRIDDDGISSEGVGTLSITVGKAFQYNKTTLSCAGGISPEESTSESIPFEIKDVSQGTAVDVNGYFTSRAIAMALEKTGEDNGGFASVSPEEMHNSPAYTDKFTISANASQGYRIETVSHNAIVDSGEEDLSSDNYNASSFEAEYFLDTNVTFGYQEKLVQYVKFGYAWVNIWAYAQNDSGGGTDFGDVSIDGEDSWKCDRVNENIKLVAKAKSGYRFVKWTSTGLDSSETLTDAEVTWTIPTSVTPTYLDGSGHVTKVATYTVTWTAHFVKTYKVTTRVNIGGCATVELSPEATNPDQSYDKGTQIRATATPKENCVFLGFINWTTWNDSKNPQKGMKYVQKSPWDITVSEDMEIVAEAEPDDGKILYSANSIFKGYILMDRGYDPDTGEYTGSGNILHRGSEYKMD